LPNFKRGEIWLVDLNPQEYRAEIAKDDRPCLVIQADLINDHGYTSTIVIPCTTSTYQDDQGDGFPLKVNIGLLQKPGYNPENTDAFVAALRAISNERFKGTQPIAKLGRAHIKRIEEAMKLVLGM
jgi:mRNA interferase MazF